MNTLISEGRLALLDLTDSKLLSILIEIFLWLLVASLLTSMFQFLLRFILKRVKIWTSRSRSHWDEWAVSVLGQTRSWFVFTWIAVGILRFNLDGDRMIALVRIPMVIVTVAQLMIWGLRAVSIWRSVFLSRKGESDRSSMAAVGLIQLLLNAALISCLVLLGLANLGVDIAALVAGLGVGGIAVALAAQNVLGDLLASLSIVLDKPFVVDDFIIVGNEMGTVESIGLKTTRVRSLGGEQLIFSNKDLLESRVRNMKRMKERRVAHRFGVVYSTPPEKLAAIPRWVRESVESRPSLRFERCHFIQLAASALEFELVFWVNSPDFHLFADAQQELLMDLLKKFSKAGVEFASPKWPPL